MRSFAIGHAWGGNMLLACVAIVQLSACGSDIDPVMTAEAVELRQSSSAPTANAVSTKPVAGPTTTSTAGATANATTTGSAIDSSDSRVIYWIDPREPFAEMRKWTAATQVHGPNQLLADVREPGIVGAGSDYAFSRVADPLDSTKSAFRHRLAGSFPTWGTVGARRSEVSADWSTRGATVMRGVDYWVAFAIKFEPDMFGSGNGGASLLDFHQVPDGGENWLPSSLAMMSGDNSISFVARWDSGQPTISSNPPTRQLWSEISPSTTQWHRFVMKVRLHWDPAQQPYVRIWRSLGSGPLQQIANYEGPNDYNNNAPYVPQKFGLYRWDSWSGKPTRTIYTKGFYVVKSQTGSPAIDEQLMNQLLGQI